MTEGISPDAMKVLGAGLAAGLGMIGPGIGIGILGAALRLGMVGHSAVQSILSKSHAVVETILKQPCPLLDEVTSFTPEQEIAVMRHEVMSSRLFIN